MVTGKVLIPNQSGHVLLNQKWPLVPERNFWWLAGTIRFSLWGIWSQDVEILSPKLSPWRMSSFPWDGHVWTTCNEVRKPGLPRMRERERRETYVELDTKTDVTLGSGEFLASTDDILVPVVIPGEAYFPFLSLASIRSLYVFLLKPPFCFC